MSSKTQPSHVPRREYSVRLCVWQYTVNDGPMQRSLNKCRRLPVDLCDLIMEYICYEWAVGDTMYCRDTVYKWLAATVIGVNAARGMIRVRYDGWADAWNEWLFENSERLAFKCIVQIDMMHIAAAYVDLKALEDAWVVARIISPPDCAPSMPGFVLLRYETSSGQRDTWVEEASNRIALLHTFTVPHTLMTERQLCGCVQEPARDRKKKRKAVCPL